MQLGKWIWDGADGAALERALEKQGSRNGVLFMGIAGSGKTCAARSLLGDGLFVNMAEPTARGWLAEWRGWLGDGRNILLDDLGKEPAVEVVFGTRGNAAAAFLSQVYGEWQMRAWNGRLFVTTNLTDGELRERYGESNVDRLRAMCAVCVFSENRRPSAGAVREEAAEGPGAGARERYEGCSFSTARFMALDLMREPDWFAKVRRIAQNDLRAWTAAQGETVGAVRRVAGTSWLRECLRRMAEKFFEGADDRARHWAMAALREANMQAEAHPVCEAEESEARAERWRRDTRPLGRGAAEGRTAAPRQNGDGWRAEG